MIEARIISSLQTPHHLRELARELNTSPSYIHRKLKELEQKGVVTSHSLGKRLVYSLIEENPLVQGYTAMTRYQELLSGLGPYAAAVFNVCHFLKRMFGESLISVHVFGSVARGSWKRDESKTSDLDMMVIVKKLPERFVERVELFTEISTQILLRYKIKIDLIPYDIDDIKFADPFREEIKKTGIVVYGDLNWT